MRTSAAALSRPVRRPGPPRGAPCGTPSPEAPGSARQRGAGGEPVHALTAPEGDAGLPTRTAPASAAGPRVPGSRGAVAVLSQGGRQAGGAPAMSPPRTWCISGTATGRQDPQNRGQACPRGQRPGGRQRPPRHSPKYGSLEQPFSRTPRGVHSTRKCRTSSLARSPAAGGHGTGRGGHGRAGPGRPGASGSGHRRGRPRVLPDWGRAAGPGADGTGWTAGCPPRPPVTRPGGPLGTAGCRAGNQASRAPPGCKGGGTRRHRAVRERTCGE